MLECVMLAYAHKLVIAFDRVPMAWTARSAQPQRMVQPRQLRYFPFSRLLFSQTEHQSGSLKRPLLQNFLEQKSKLRDSFSSCLRVPPEEL